MKHNGRSIDYMDKSLDFFFIVNLLFTKKDCQKFLPDDRDYWRLYEMDTNEVTFYERLPCTVRSKLVEWYNNRVNESESLKSVKTNVRIEDIDASLEFFIYIDKGINKLVRDLWMDSFDYYANKWNTVGRKSWAFYRILASSDQFKIDVWYRRRKVKPYG